MSDQKDLLERAARVLPGGVLGSHRSGPGLEFVVREGRGGHLYDVNGRRYIDYLLGSGPMVLGHAHPAVVEAVRRQMDRGTSYMLLNEPSIELAEEIVRAVPCAEQVVDVPTAVHVVEMAAAVVAHDELEARAAAMAAEHAAGQDTGRALEEIFLITHDDIPAPTKGWAIIPDVTRRRAR